MAWEGRELVLAWHSQIQRNMTVPKVHTASTLQGAFWLASGLWPLLHLKSFEIVTGPKKDDWLVKSIGGLISVVGATLLVGSRERRQTKSLKTLAVGSALVLGTADVVYSFSGRISKIYLLDAVAQAAFLGLWTTEVRERKAVQIEP